MTTRIIHKKSSVSGKAPTPTQLAFGELAVNTFDGVVYLKKDPGTGETVIALKEVTETNLEVDSSGLAYSDGSNLSQVLEDLDNAIGVIAAGGDPGSGGGDSGSLDGATLDDIVALAIALG